MGVATAWIPESKKIWFTEFGYPSVDGCANEPNVFYDPSSSESAFPRFSKGQVDFVAQRTAIEAAIDKWTGSAMVERMFLWCWDARPYPFFPDLRSVWSDGDLWLYGHWVNGKLGLTSLAAVISELCATADLNVNQVNVLAINDLLAGFLLNSVSPARAALEQLQKGFFFDAVESDGVMKFIPRGSNSILSLTSDELIPQQNSKTQSDVLKVLRAQEIDLPQKVDVTYIDQALDYQIGDQSSQRQATFSTNKDSQSLSIVFNDWQAKSIADISLYNAWYGRNSYQFSLPLQYLDIEAADVVEIDGISIRITDSTIGLNGEIKCKGTADDPSIYDFYVTPSNLGNEAQIVAPVSSTRLEILDIPAFSDGDVPYLRFAACGVGKNWNGAVVYRSDDGGVTYNNFTEIVQAGTIGNVLTVLPVASADLVDEVSIVQVSLVNGELESVSELAMLNGANIALIGNEIVQFQNAVLVSENTYQLSYFLRGRQGTEFEIGSHRAGERFVLLDNSIVKEQMPTQLIGVSRAYKGVSIGASLGSASEIDFTFGAESLRPFSPVEIASARDGSGNLTISWLRRTRVGGELRDGVDVPLSEETEAYSVDVLNGSAVVRTIDVSSPSVSYSAAQQVADFGTTQTLLSVNIYQISALVGRGIAGYAII